MASLPQKLGSQFFFFTRQTTSTTWCSCTSTSTAPQTRFLFLNNGPAAAIRSRLFHGAARRVKNTTPRRNASSSSAAAKKPSAATSPIISTIKPTTSALRSYVERLATKGSRTLLYEAPSHFWYRVSSFAAGAFCITYTVVQYWEVYLHPHEGLATWVPHAFGVICIFMTAMGLYFVMGTQHIVRSIEVVPRALLSKKQLTTLPKSAAAETPILIQVSMQRPFPFLPQKKKLYTPEEIQLPFRMHGVLGNLVQGQIPETPKQVTMVESVRAERAAREARAREIQFRRDHILTSPFRDGAKVGKQVAGSVWSSIKRPFFREGFAKILLGKREYKLDISGGWALDDGRALDRLFTVRPAPGISHGRE
ncbi:hypothetical protein V8F20_004498 [Naviculisporaceae sp. PSN 640]